MSDRYLSSPTLRLRIGSSRLRTSLFWLLCMMTCCTLWAICERGYAVLALLLSPPAAGLLWRLRRDAAEGSQVCWRAGVWTLEQYGVRRVISPLARCTVTPWLVYLVFADLAAGSVGRLWLYVDSAPREPMRQLRVRLTLMR